jgi:hypothetical protein
MTKATRLPYAVTLLALLAMPPSEAATPIDLPRLIECRAEVGDYTQLAMRIGQDEKALGFIKVKQPNTFIVEYQLAKPITVFGGYKTQRIAFGSSGILAILDGKQATPKGLATKLKLQAFPMGTHQTIYARVIKDDTDVVASIVIRLNASTIDSHPGKTFIGCEYRVDVK